MKRLEWVKTYLYTCFVWLLIIAGIIAIVNRTQPKATITISDEGTEVCYTNIDPSDVNDIINGGTQDEQTRKEDQRSGD